MAPGNAPAGSVPSPPPIHFDQTSVLTDGGVAKEEQAYHFALDNCKKAGFPIHALTPGDVAKIGRVHLEMWIGPDRMARHEEQWGMDVTPPCNFSLTRRDQTWIADANGRLTTIDNVTHQVDVGQGDGPPWTGGPLPESDGEMDAAHRQNGWSKLGVANSNGAQCAIWQLDGTGDQYCVWSGGRQWGYSSDGAEPLHGGVSVGPSIAGSSIVLWAHPGKAGWTLETQAFSVGQPLDPRAFELPANASAGTRS
jgi:hypothetical protein